MNIPIRRRDDRRRSDREFAQLRPAFASELDQWPDFVRSIDRTVNDVPPLADIEETDDSYLLDVELPGVRREDVDLLVDQGRVVVTGERQERERVGLLRHRTRTTGRFALAVTLPGPVDGESVTASFADGMLSVVVPKAERARRRRIPIGQRG